MYLYCIIQDTALYSTTVDRFRLGLKNNHIIFNDTSTKSAMLQEVVQLFKEQNQITN